MKKIITAKEAAKYALSDIENITRKQSSGGLFTGFSDIDSSFSGFSAGELAVVGGVPSSGKTSLIFNICEHIAFFKKKHVLIISSESSPKQLVLRIIASLGSVNIQRLRTGKILDEEWSRFAGAVKLVANSHLSFIDIPNFEMNEIKETINKACKESEISAIAIDGLQNIRFSDSDNKATELANVTRELKSIALKNNLFIIVSSHLNRYLYQRSNKRAFLRDLAGAGSVEYDADYVILIYRDEQFNNNADMKGLAEIHFAKNRMGYTFNVKLFFNHNYLRFEDNIQPTFEAGFSP